LKRKVRQTLREWFDERVGLDIFERMLQKPLPKRGAWFYTLGSATLSLITLQFVTGAFLMFYYVPDGEFAESSIRYITEQVSYGWYLRSLHRWSANLLFVAIGLHMFRVFVSGSFKRPREMTWVIGGFIFLTVIGIGLTGGLLPWDDNALWIGTVFGNTLTYFPLIGPFLRKALLGGEHVGTLTLTRFYALHVWALPLVLGILVTLHLYLIRKHGLFGSVVEYRDQIAALEAKGVPREAMAITKMTPDETEPFYPTQVFRDSIVAFGLITTVSVLSTLFPFSPEGEAPPPAHIIPRPEWFFWSVDEWLMYFPGRLVPVGLITLTLFLLFLPFVPFVERHPEVSPIRRPTPTLIGAWIYLFIIVLALMAGARILNY
jgi:quinol-cytochrome oxidoreductase complex cytochrome b subunit